MATIDKEELESIEKKIKEMEGKIESVLDIVLEHFKENETRIEELEIKYEDLIDGVAEKIS